MSDHKTANQGNTPRSERRRAERRALPFGSTPFDALMQRLADIVAHRVAALVRDRPPEAAPTAALIDIDAAAVRLGIAKSTLYKRAASGVLPSVKDGGRLLFAPEDLDKYVAARRRSPGRVTALAHAVVKRARRRSDPSVVAGQDLDALPSDDD